MHVAMKAVFPVIIEQDEDGIYIASCPVLQGCHTYGRTVQEALANIKEAIEAHLEARMLMGDPVPDVRMVEVEVA
jgi:predicted RNase H-like HicB family nuclease